MPLKGGIIKALTDARNELNCDTVQIFSKNPRGWKPAYADHATTAEVKIALNMHKISPLVLHSIYLINLASSNEEIYEKSVKALTEDVLRAETLGAQFLVTHVGSGEKEEAINRLLDAIDRAYTETDVRNTILLLENSSGAGKHVGELEFIGKVIEKSKWSKNLGLCFDTAHAYARGFDLSNKKGWNECLKIIKNHVGMEKLYLIHANDCASALGSKIDRHKDIGKGGIGLEGFRIMLSLPELANLPVILETPKKSIEDDRRNLKVIRKLAVI